MTASLQPEQLPGYGRRAEHTGNAAASLLEMPAPWFTLLLPGCETPEQAALANNRFVAHAALAYVLTWTVLTNLFFFFFWYNNSPAFLVGDLSSKVSFLIFS